MASRANARVAAIVGFAAVGVALCIAFFASWGDEEPRLAGGSPKTASGTEHDDRSGSNGDINPAATRDDESAASAPADLASLPSRSLDIPDFVPTIGPSITVVARETGRALPDAGVWWMARDEVDDAKWRALQRGEVAALEAIERDGHAVELDALGGAELPWHAGLARIWVRHGDRDALRTLALDEAARHRIELARAETLTIRTADADGRPVGNVPVMVAACAVKNGQLAFEREEPLHLAAGSTDRDGVFRCERGSRWLDERLDGDGLATRAALVAALAFPCRDRRTTAIDPREGCKQPVELRPPLMAELRFRAAMENDAQCLVPVAIRVTCSDANRDALPTFTAEGVIAVGEAWLQTVEAEANFRIEAWSLDRALIADPIVAKSGAVATTVELLLRLRPVEPPPMATLLVLDPERRPLATTDVAWQLAEAIHFPRRGALVVATTDERGRLPVPIERLPRAPAGSSVTLQLYARLLDGGNGGACQRGQLALTKSDFADGDVLGQVVMEELPTIVAGRVVSSRGAGLSGAIVHVVDRKCAWMDSNRIAKEELTIGERVHWATRSGENGRFEIRSKRTCDDIVINATLLGWSHRTTVDSRLIAPHDEAGAGDASVTVVMVRNGRARGRLLAEPGTSFRRLTLRAVPGTRGLRRVEVEDDGQFEIEGVPGSLVLQVVSRTDAVIAGVNRDPEDAVILAQVDGLTLIEDQLVSDPRLDPIDLRDRLATLVLTARAPSGEPIAGARLYFVDNGGHVVELDPRVDPFGRAVISTPFPTPRLYVGLAGRLTQLVRFDRPEVELWLPPAPRLRLVLPGQDHPLRNVPAWIKLAREAGYSSAAIASLIGPDRCRDAGHDRDGNVLLEAELPFAGRWVVSFSRDQDAWRSLWSQTVEVSAEKTVVEVRVDLTAAQLREIERTR